MAFNWDILWRRGWGNPYRVYEEWRNVWVRHVPIVWGILLAAKGVSFRPLFVEPSSLLWDGQSAFQESNLPERFAGCAQFPFKGQRWFEDELEDRLRTDSHHHELHAVKVLDLTASPWGLSLAIHRNVDIAA